MATCTECGGDGYYKGPRLGDEPCPGCDGTGKQPDNLLAVAVAARELWASRDPTDQKGVKRLHDAWRALGVALAHLGGRRHISEA